MAPRRLLVLAALAVTSCSEVSTPEARSHAFATQLLQAMPAARLVANVSYKDVADLDRLVSEHDAVEKADRRAGYVVLLLSGEEYDALLQQGYRIELDEAATERLNRAPKPIEGQLSGIPGFPCYRTVEESYSTMAQLAELRPDLARWVDIGDTWDKVTAGGREGYDVYALVVTNRAVPGPKPVFFLMGGIHAREYTTAETVARFAEYLINNYNVDPDVTWLLDHSEAHLVVHTNPDGRKVAEQGYYQRKNMDNTYGSCPVPPTSSSQYGTDLNRNSTYLWGGSGSSTSPCTQTYRGPAPGSAPEVQAIQNHLVSIFPDQRGPADTDPAPADTTGVMITLHSYAQLVLFPWGANSTPAPNMAALQTLGRKFGYFNGYEVCQPPLCLYAASGTTDDYAYGTLGVASYTFEMGTDFFEGCDSFQNVVLPQNLPALLYAFKAARRPYQNAGGPDSISLSLSSSSVVEGNRVTLMALGTDTRSASNGNGYEPLHNVTAGRYTVDVPSWAPGAVTRPLAAWDGFFNTPVEWMTASIDTTGWGPGRHTVFVEAQDSSGAWGVPAALFLRLQPRSVRLYVSPPSASSQAVVGKTVDYVLSVKNAGNAPDTFDVTVGGNAWQTTAAAAVGPVAAGASATVRVTVSVPAGADFGSTDLTRVLFTSRGDPTKTVSAALTTIAVSSDATAPVTAVTSPASGETLSGVAFVTASATDDKEVTRVEIYADGALLGADTLVPFEVSWDTTQVGDGAHVLTSRAYDAAGNVSTSAGVPVTVENGAACSVRRELLANGGFEGGPADWELSGADVIEDSLLTPARSGKFKASLLGYGVAGSERIVQGVEIPASACSATLRFYVRITTSEPSSAEPHDELVVQLQDESGAVLQTLGRYSNLEASAEYVGRTFDLAPYREKKIRLTFVATENKDAPTEFLVDDVSLEVTEDPLKGP